MTEVAEHRWLGYRPVAGHRFIAVCSCGWNSPPQGTAGLAGALLDAHREEARSPSSQDPTGDAVAAPAERPDAGPAGDSTTCRP